MHNQSSASRSKLVVIARTHMREERICLGALDLETGTLRRLNRSHHQSFMHDAPFEVGQVWDIHFVPDFPHTNPHNEDVIVCSWKATDIGSSLGDLLHRTPAREVVFCGNPFGLYQGKLHWIRGGAFWNAVVQDKSLCPDFSLHLWRTDREMHLHPDRFGGFHYRSHLPEHNGWWSVAYKGTESPRSVIPPGSIISLSLARWWPKQDPINPPRCYVQICNVLDVPETLRI